jgi:predicted RecA/RadA family phage recombinase
MASNFNQPGCVLEFTAPTGGVTVEVPVLIGGLVVIPLVTAAQTVRFNARIDGVWTVPKTAGVAWTEGANLYWDSTAGSFATAQSATARRAGFATAAASSGATSGSVLLNNIGAAVNVA